MQIKHLQNLLLFGLLFFYSFGYTQSYDVVWTNVTNATVDGNTIIKTGNNGYNSGASSTNTLSPMTDGWVEVTVNQVNKHRFVGLASTDASLAFRDIDFSIFILSNKHFRVHEKAVYKGDFGVYSAGDKFRIERVGDQINYLKNDVIFYTSTTPSTSSLLVDASLFHSGASLENVVTSFPANADDMPNTEDLVAMEAASDMVDMPANCTTSLTSGAFKRVCGDWSRMTFSAVERGRADGSKGVFTGIDGDNIYRGIFTEVLPYLSLIHI